MAQKHTVNVGDAVVLEDPAQPPHLRYTFGTVKTIHKGNGNVRFEFERPTRADGLWFRVYDGPSFFSAGDNFPRYSGVRVTTPEEARANFARNPARIRARYAERALSEVSSMGLSAGNASLEAQIELLEAIDKFFAVRYPDPPAEMDSHGLARVKMQRAVKAALDTNFDPRITGETP